MNHNLTNHGYHQKKYTFFLRFHILFLKDLHAFLLLFPVDRLPQCEFSHFQSQSPPEGFVLYPLQKQKKQPVLLRLLFLFLLFLLLAQSLRLVLPVHLDYFVLKHLNQNRLVPLAAAPDNQLTLAVHQFLQNDLFHLMIASFHLANPLQLIRSLQFLGYSYLFRHLRQHLFSHLICDLVDLPHLLK